MNQQMQFVVKAKNPFPKLPKPIFQIGKVIWIAICILEGNKSSCVHTTFSQAGFAIQSSIYFCKSLVD
jgi:hypothetical protein